MFFEKSNGLHWREKVNHIRFSAMFLSILQIAPYLNLIHFVRNAHRLQKLDKTYETNHYR